MRHKGVYNVEPGDKNNSDKHSWYVDSEVEMDDGTLLRHRHVIPKDTFEWRAAEYDIDPSDYDTLIDIVMCEQYLDMDWFDDPNSLFKAPTIAVAREAYIAKIAEAKLQHRVSTRGVGHPLNLIREEMEHNPMRMALKSMSVQVQRHITGVEEIPEHILRTYVYLQEAFQPVAEEGGRNIDPEKTAQVTRKGYPLPQARNGNK